MSKGLIAVLAVVGIVLLGFLIFYFWGTSIYDKAITSQEEVNEAFANVQTQYQRRADLIPNLVATVKEAAENERGILTEVTQARAGITNAQTPEDLEIAGRRINTAINLAFEAYPQIRSTENFKDLQSQLEGTENRISVARERYNEAVKKYNSYVRGYFKKMALGIYGADEDFSPKKGFQASAGSEDAPSVKNAFDEK